MIDTVLQLLLKKKVVSQNCYWSYKSLTHSYIKVSRWKDILHIYIYKQNPPIFYLQTRHRWCLFIEHISVRRDKNHSSHLPPHPFIQKSTAGVGGVGTIKPGKAPSLCICSFIYTPLLEPKITWAHLLQKSFALEQKEAPRNYSTTEGMLWLQPTDNEMEHVHMTVLCTKLQNTL